MRYGVILADPPWRYNVDGGFNGTAEAEYQTMSLDDIKALPIKDRAAADSVLLCWATWPLLREGLEVVEAWGFRYVTGFPWVKVTSVQGDLFEGAPRIEVPYGIGFWARGASEPLLIGKRGKPTLPEKDFIGLLSPNLQHSRKPDSVYEYAEALAGPRLELFARRQRAGWDVFGNEVAGSINLEISNGDENEQHCNQDRDDHATEGGEIPREEHPQSGT